MIATKDFYLNRNLVEDIEPYETEATMCLGIAYPESDVKPLASVSYGSMSSTKFRFR